MNKTDIEIAREQRRGHIRCAACREGKVITSEERGIRPMIMWLEEDPDMLRGASVADKIVGRAAAMIMIYAGVKEVFAEVISRRAYEILTEYNIPCNFINSCEAIANRRNDGICPMEKATAPISDPKEAYQKLRDIVINNNQ